MTLRRLPSDFQVDERLAPEWLDALAQRWAVATPFAVYRLSKTGLNTPDAVAHFCRALRMGPGAASYAGLKDKHAVTAQHVTVHAADLVAAKAMPDEQQGTGWRARRMGWSADALSASAIASNDFCLVVRSLRPASMIAMDRAIAALQDSQGDRLLIANYFGDQRFGSARHGQGFAAQALVAGEFVEAIRLLVGTPARKDQGRSRDFTRLCAAHWGDWSRLARDLPACPERAPIERLAAGAAPAQAFAALPKFLQGMCIEAFQSLLWNETIRGLIQANQGDVLQVDDAFGPLVFPVAAGVRDAWRALRVPMLAPGVQLEGEWAPHARTALEQRGLTLESLRAPGLERPFFGHASRPMLVHASEFSVGDAQPDEVSDNGASRRTVRFSLPRGAYATVVMRALGQ